MSSRLFNPENRLTLLNLLTPVMKTNFRCSSASFSTEYRSFRPSRISVAVTLSVMLSRMGLSYRRSAPDRLTGLGVQALDQVGEAAAGIGETGRASPAGFRARAVSGAGPHAGLPIFSTPAPKLMRMTGCFVQSHRVSAARPLNSAALPSNSSFSVSRNRLYQNVGGA